MPHHPGLLLCTGSWAATAHIDLEQWIAAALFTVNRLELEEMG